MLWSKSTVPLGRLATHMHSPTIARSLHIKPNPKIASFHRLTWHATPLINRVSTSKIYTHAKRDGARPLYRTSSGELVPEVPSPFNSRLQRWPAGTIVDRNCNEVRRLINKLIDGREFTYSTLQKRLGVSRDSMARFLTDNGQWAGKKSDTYAFALRYLQERESEGIRMPRKVSKPTPIPDVHLKGQETDQVEVLDWPRDIQNQIMYHMRRPGITQAAFLKDLSAQFYAAPIQIKASDLAKFRGTKKFTHQKLSPVIYSAYCFFERHRIGSNIKESKDRQQRRERARKMSENFGAGGFSPFYKGNVHDST